MNPWVNCQELGSCSDWSIKDRILILGIKIMIGYISTIMHDQPAAHCKSPLILNINWWLSCQPDCMFAKSEPLEYTCTRLEGKTDISFSFWNVLHVKWEDRKTSFFNPVKQFYEWIPWQIWVACLCNCIHPPDLLQWDTILQHLMTAWSQLLPCSHPFEQWHGFLTIHQTSN